MAFATAQAVKDSIYGHQPVLVYKGGLAGLVVAQWGSLWKQATQGGVTTPWQPGSTPPTGAGEAPGAATTGAYPLPAAVGGQSRYVLAAKAHVSTLGGHVRPLLVADRLVHTAGVNPNTTSAQTVNTTALARATNGLGVMAGLEIYTTPTGAVNSTCTFSYTNAAGTAGQTSTIATGFTGNNTSAGEFYFMPLAAGDTGVKSVETVTFSAASSGSASWGVTLFKPVLYVSLAPSPDSGSISGYDWSRDWKELCLPVVPDDACLFVLHSGNESNLQGVALELLFGYS